MKIYMMDGRNIYLHICKKLKSMDDVKRCTGHLPWQEAELLTGMSISFCKRWPQGTISCMYMHWSHRRRGKKDCLAERGREVSSPAQHDENDNRQAIITHG